MKKVCIIYTGGTIGMIRTPKGYAPQKGFLEKNLLADESFKDPSLPEWDMVELSPLLDSSNMTVREWNIIAEEIEKRYDDYCGFVVLHGTDTMAYTASAMSFMLEGLNKAVVFTGSQIPLCRMRSDGIDNLVTSMLVAASGEVREVCLYFGGLLLRGNRATKISADDLEAFASPNYPRLAEIGTSITYRKKFLREGGAEPFSLFEVGNVPIAVIKMFPGFSYDLLAAVLEGDVRGIVLEAFGAGNIPDGHSLAPLLEAAKERGTVIVVTSQCGKGNVELGAYAASMYLTRAGAVSGRDMTTEAAVAKLYYLFSKYNDAHAVKELMESDLRGEVSIEE